ncbi:MAG: hypothetical protein AAF280_14200 [Pseudomonadota bacterium]
MADPSKSSNRVTGIAVGAFVVVTAVLLLPGYIARWSAEPPDAAEYQVRYAIETKTRVFDGEGRFGRIPGDVGFGKITAFSCEPSREARREFGWRGARELIFDCPSTFEDASGGTYAWVFRLIPDEDAPSPDGYRTMHIPAEEARIILEENGMFP